MVKLFCAIVGEAGSAFEVKIDDAESVSALKKAIKEENPATIKCDTKDLQLFPAKAADSGWLSSKHPDVISMRNGSIPEQVGTLMDVEVDPADEIGDVFGGA
ncbi:hypothetical protein PI125_g26753, partial [Phytophthora idaei]